LVVEQHLGKEISMALKVERVDTWAVSIEDKPGGLATKLNALADAGANLEFVIARREPEKPGTGVVFVTPIKGTAAVRVARQAGFAKTDSLHTVRIEGVDKPGQGAKIAQALAERGLNLRGLSAASLGRKFVAHVALGSAADAATAMRRLRGMYAGVGREFHKRHLHRDERPGGRPPR
jgi:hypothetical protein